MCVENVRLEKFIYHYIVKCFSFRRCAFHFFIIKLSRAQNDFKRAGNFKIHDASFRTLKFHTICFNLFTDFHFIFYPPRYQVLFLIRTRVCFYLNFKPDSLLTFLLTLSWLNFFVYKRRNVSFHNINKRNFIIVAVV